MRTPWLMIVVVLMAAPVSAQVPYERILDAESEPGSWLTYSGTYGAQRYSTLDRINRDNVDRLQPAWVYQVRSTQKFEVSPLVVDGVMYITEAPSDATALDLRTGRPIWSYRRPLPEGIVTCCGQVNRGVALLDDQVFLGTVDAHLVALDARTGRVHWDVEVADYTSGHSITVAPARAERQDHRRHRRRRVWHPWISRRLRSGHRRTVVAFLDGAGAGRAWSRDVVWRQLGARRGTDLGDGCL